MLETRSRTWRCSWSRLSIEYSVAPLTPFSKIFSVSSTYMNARAADLAPPNRKIIEAALTHLASSVFVMSSYLYTDAKNAFVPIRDANLFGNLGGRRLPLHTELGRIHRLRPKKNSLCVFIFFFSLDEKISSTRNFLPGDLYRSSRALYLLTLEQPSWPPAEGASACPSSDSSKPWESLRRS